MNQELRIKNRLTLAALASFLIFNFAFFITPTYALTVCCKEGNVLSGPYEDDAACDSACLEDGATCLVPSACTTAPPSAGPPRPAGPTPTAVELPNPLGTTDFTIIVGNIIRVFTGGAGIIALLVFIYGGFQWLTAAGNPEKIKKGRDILLWALLGIVVMFSSYIITNYLLRAILTGVVNP